MWNRAKNHGPNRFTLLVDKYNSIIIKLNLTPSHRPFCMAARTTTPYTTCPLFTFPPSWASFTDATIVSPNQAPFFPFKACMHITRFAPELSTTFKLDRICMKVLICCKRHKLRKCFTIHKFNRFYFYIK